MIICILLIVVLGVFVYLLWDKNNHLKQENEQIKSNDEMIQNQYGPIIDLEKIYRQTNKELEIEQKHIEKLRSEYSEKYKIYIELKEKIELFNDEIKYIDYGLYTPHYDFQTSAIFKQKLDVNIEEQKQAIKSLDAVECDTSWIVQGSKSMGAKMIEKERKLLLLAFNAQCDREIEKVKWNNIYAIEKKMYKLFNDLNKLGELHDIYITEEFYELKKEQLYITHEYEQKKQEEKEEQRRIREQMREEEKVQKELEKRQKELEEQEKREEELKKLLEQAYNQGKQEEAIKYQEEIAQLNETIENSKRAISNAQLTKWGRIYIISNIGSFGENVYKIGMTRRDDPMERINELGDASVPFKFDVHAIIESDNAPELENKLHDIFKKQSVNRINYRKEFFRVSLNEIEKAVNETVGSEIIFTKIADAKEFRETQAILRAEAGEEIIDNKETELIPQEI